MVSGNSTRKVAFLWSLGSSLDARYSRLRLILSLDTFSAVVAPRAAWAPHYVTGLRVLQIRIPFGPNLLVKRDNSASMSG